MKNFDQRWQILTEQARQMPGQEAPQAPWGFATRVAARLRERPQETWEDIFIRLGMRAAWAAFAILVLSAGLVLSDWTQPRLELPQVGVSLDSDLLWP